MSDQCPPPAVHPRVRGERIADTRAAAFGFGSSPRARGTACPRAGRVQERRFIPACAGNGFDTPSTMPLSAVHPRVRGERGEAPPAAPRIGRFIPACAGNGGWPCSRSHSRTVHPRVRGERFFLGFLLRLADGSSPRARGTGAAQARGRRRFRFIPACAGNGVSLAATSAFFSVHPRVRGERPSIVSAARAMDGSSPRARGTARLDASGRRASRFIPACAGNGDTA